jgi:phosphate transport system protein
MIFPGVPSFGSELLELDGDVAQMGGIVEDLVWRAAHALGHRNPTMAAHAVRGDAAVDDLERKVQDRVIRLIEMPKSTTAEVRHAIAVLKIACDLERIGDLSKNIAHRAVAISDDDLPRQLLLGIEHMTKLAAGQLKDVLDAWSARDERMALHVWRRDINLDALYNSVFRDTLDWMIEDPRNVEYSTHLLFAAKNLERIGDHTTNIAEQIVLLVTGTSPRNRSKGDNTSSLAVDETRDERC